MRFEHSPRESLISGARVRSGATCEALSYANRRQRARHLAVVAGSRLRLARAAHYLCARGSGANYDSKLIREAVFARRVSP